MGQRGRGIEHDVLGRLWGVVAVRGMMADAASFDVRRGDHSHGSPLSGLCDHQDIKTPFLN